MFSPDTGKQKSVIQHIPIYTPDPGYVWNYHKKKFEKSPILRLKDNCWQRETFPEWWAKKRGEESKKQKSDPTYSDTDCQQFRKTQWHRRLYGLWFLNNKTPTYITGMHWMYLQWWAFPKFYPAYRDPDRQYFYLLQWAIECPFCYGMMDLEQRQVGKCFGENTPIRMYDGSVKMVQDVVDGDLVMGDDSTPRMVSGSTSGKEMMYEVRLSYSDPFVCNESHILHCYYNGIDDCWFAGKLYHKNDTVNISVKDYLELTDSKKDHLVMRRSGWDVTRQESFELPPYFLGIWLGDGFSNCQGITIADDEILSYIKDYCVKNNLHIRQKNKYDYNISTDRSRKIRLSYQGKDIVFNSTKQASSCVGFKEPRSILNEKFLITHNIEVLNDFRYKSKFKELFRKYNLLNNKHIPQEYLLASKKSRLELLAGLIDTDGHCDIRKDKNGNLISSHYEIIQKNYSLAKDIEELCNGLGYRTSFKNKIATMKRKDGSIYKCPVYRVSFNGNSLSEIPCKVSRKKWIDSKSRYNKDQEGFRVYPVGVGKYYGFAVDGNHLFLLKNGIIVHNTQRSGLFIYEHCSRTIGAQGGIQSKSLEEARDKVYRKAVLNPFLKLPDFFQPIYDTSTRLTTGMQFRPTLTMGKYQDLSVMRGALDSGIGYEDSGEMACDGATYERYVADEIFKTKNVDIRSRHEVILAMLAPNGDIDGKALYTSTVEDMEDKNDIGLQMWKDSDQSTVDIEHGEMTSTGLIRFYSPSYENYKNDKYGFADVEANKKYFLVERKKRSHNLKVLNDYIRKHSFTWQEAFRFTNASKTFNSSTIQDALDNITFRDNQYLRRGNFEWIRRDEELIWVDDERGPIETVYLLDEHSDRIAPYGDGVLRPKNGHMMSFGVDPFDHYRDSKYNKYSNAGGYVKMKYLEYLKNKYYNDCFILQYLDRPEDPDTFFEDMIKICFYLSIPMLYEDQADGIRKYFETRGYARFLEWLPGATKPGISASPRVKENMVLLYKKHFIENKSRHYFRALLEQMSVFDIMNTQKSDAVMGGGYALISEDAHMVNKVDNSRPKKKNNTGRILVRKHKVRKWY